MLSARGVGGRTILLAAASMACVLAVGVLVSSGAGAMVRNVGSDSSLSPEEQSARDKEARRQLAEIARKAPFHARLHISVPSGYLYDRVIWEPAHPERGFSVWMRQVISDGRTIHIIEAPEMPNAPKNTLRLPSLKPVDLQNGRWMVLQKPDEPWRGLWIFVTVFDGVHIEVAGADRTAVESVAGGL